MRRQWDQWQVLFASYRYMFGSYTELQIAIVKLDYPPYTSIPGVNEMHPRRKD
jgi:hypothetical protein